MFSPHTVTLFNAYEDNGQRKVAITVLHGVFLDNTDKHTAGNPSVNASAVATLYIPKNVVAMSSAGVRQSFVQPKQYTDPATQWTIRPSTDAGAVDCYIAKGIVQDDSNFNTIKRTYADVYRCAGFRDCDYGTEKMHHFEVALS